MKDLNEKDFMEVKNFIEGLKSRGGFADVIDAYKLISFYVDVYGVIYMDKLSIEEELMFYYEELKKYIKIYNRENILYKRCYVCGEIKNKTDFGVRKLSKDGLNTKCKSCIKIYVDNRKNNLIDLC